MSITRGKFLAMTPEEIHNRAVALIRKMLGDNIDDLTIEHEIRVAEELIVASYAANYFLAAATSGHSMATDVTLTSLDNLTQIAREQATQRAKEISDEATTITEEGNHSVH